MKNSIIIRAGGVNEHFNLPWIKLAESDFSQKKYCVEWNNVAGGTGVLVNLLHKNEIDLAVLLTEGLLLDIIKNKELKLVCFHVKNPLRWGIHIRKKDNKTNFDFSKKKFAVSRLGSGSHTMAKFLLNENKIEYLDSNMIEVGSLEGGLDSLQKGSSDVFLWEKFTTEPFLEKYELQCIGEVKTPWPPFSVAVKKEYYDKNTEIIFDILKDIQQISKIIVMDPKTIDEINLRWGITKENAQRWISEIEWDDQLLTNEALLNHIFENMKKAGLITENILI